MNATGWLKEPEEVSGTHGTCKDFNVHGNVSDIHKIFSALLP